MAQCISNSLYEQAVPAMPVKPFVEEPHNQGGEGPFAAVHFVLDRKDWHKQKGWEDAIQNEVNGLLANGVWSFDEVVARDDLINQAQAVYQNLLNQPRILHAKDQRTI